MLIYATPTDLSGWTGVDAPANAVVLLRKASSLVREATAGARYGTDAEGYPVDIGVRAAMRDATCEHAATLAAHGIDPQAGMSQLPQQVQSKSADGRSVTYAADDRRGAVADLAAGQYLTDEAVRILREQGLVTTRIVSATIGVSR